MSRAESANSIAEDSLTEADTQRVRVAVDHLFGQERLSLQLSPQDFDPQWSARA